jgi:hypothetical protein
MNVKNTLKSRIRGWFPQEPKLSIKYLKKSPIEAKTKIDTTKRVSVSLLSVIGTISFVFSIINFIFYPHRWNLASDLNVAFLVFGAVLITLAIIIQKMKITETKQTPS